MSEEKKDGISPVATSPSIDEGQMAAEKQMRDIGADLYLEVRQYTREELDAERKVVLRKIDWVIMPMVSPPLFSKTKYLIVLESFWTSISIIELANKLAASASPAKAHTTLDSYLEATSLPCLETC